MIPRQVRRIGEVERAVIHEQYMENGPIWDIIGNNIVRHGIRFHCVISYSYKIVHSLSNDSKTSKAYRRGGTSRYS